MKAIGIFDSGFGGLTIFRAIAEALPQFDYIYLGDNARAPYGNCSFETVYEYNLQAVNWFFKQDCPLVIIACNTASAKALKSIQQKDLPKISKEKRVLGVIRPTAEVIGNYSKTGNIGILATSGTVKSESYLKEIAHFFPDLIVHQHACPLWVPIIENNEYMNDEVNAIIQKDIQTLLNQSDQIDTVLLACTHYPLLKDKIKQYLPPNIQLVSQGQIVADSLKDYLERHLEIEEKISKDGEKKFYTTDDPIDFEAHATTFFGQKVKANLLKLKDL